MVVLLIELAGYFFEEKHTAAIKQVINCAAFIHAIRTLRTSNKLFIRDSTNNFITSTRITYS
jgi:hypothetical protein